MVTIRNSLPAPTGPLYAQRGATLTDIKYIKSKARRSSEPPQNDIVRAHLLALGFPPTVIARVENPGRDFSRMLSLIQTFSERSGRDPQGFSPAEFEALRLASTTRDFTKLLKALRALPVGFFSHAIDIEDLADVLNHHALSDIGVRRAIHLQKRYGYAPTLLDVSFLGLLHPEHYAKLQALLKATTDRVQLRFTRSAIEADTVQEVCNVKIAEQLRTELMAITAIACSGSDRIRGFFFGLDVLRTEYGFRGFPHDLHLAYLLGNGTGKEQRVLREFLARSALLQERDTSALLALVATKASLHFEALKRWLQKVLPAVEIVNSRLYRKLSPPEIVLLDNLMAAGRHIDDIVPPDVDQFPRHDMLFLKDVALWKALSEVQRGIPREPLIEEISARLRPGTPRTDDNGFYRADFHPENLTWMELWKVLLLQRSLDRPEVRAWVDHTLRRDSAATDHSEALRESESMACLRPKVVEGELYLIPEPIIAELEHESAEEAPVPPQEILFDCALLAHSHVGMDLSDHSGPSGSPTRPDGDLYVVWSQHVDGVVFARGEGGVWDTDLFTTRGFVLKIGTDPPLQSGKNGWRGAGSAP